MVSADRTLLAVPITAPDADLARQQISSARQARADVLEFRLDFMDRADWATLLAEAQLPVIATLRPKDQGGKFTGSEAQRLKLLQQISEAGPAFVDFEWPHFASSSDARSLISSITSDQIGSEKPALILSLHDFDTVPANLSSIAAEMAKAPAAIIKIVGTALDICDNLSLLDFTRTTSKPAIILAMGEAGRISRILTAKIGTYLTFSCLSPAEASAPGQIPLAELRSLYHWDRLSGSTKVFGVVGSPVAHSLSPAIHNAAFDAADFDGVYLPMLVKPGYEAFVRFMDGFLNRPWLDLSGLSVTIPHKENALRYLEEHGGSIDPLAQRIGSVNTIVISEHGKLSGYNTDLEGAIQALISGMEIDVSDLAGRQVAVLGAGGAARSIVAGLTQAAAEVLIYNRTAERAERLAQEFSAQAVPLDQLSRTPARIIVNTTSLGMHPEVNACPFPVEALRSDMTVFDMVYNPMQTRLLTEAVRAGARIVNGSEMFIRQAARQFQLWTAQPAPVELIGRVVRQSLT